LLVALVTTTGTPSIVSCSRSREGSPAQSSPASSALAQPSRTPDVPYEPSAPEVVEAMLRLADVHAKDVVYDLGCGDGRVVIAAARRGARGVCIDIDPERIRESRENAKRAGVAERIEFRTQDLFEADLKDATVVMLFLWPEVNLRLRPKLLRELAPGSRIVSHWHDMGTWKADETVQIHADERERSIYLWKVPPTSAPE
jgi:SAM-dependent methyltransferase